ncbi:MAG: FAD-dependent oxidoreductase, partial [Chlorobiales bacterium]|nr:FAD-dependent oxidoreductase [Chlorobiales bacterium]
MKTQARVVVIGGGIVGCSTLYHLTRLGWSDVVLVEKDELTSGSTWLAAGNTPLYNRSFNMTKIHAYGVELYQTLEAETDQPTGWHRTGSLRLASSQDRLTEFKHVAGKDSLIGVSSQVVTPKEIKELYPLISTSGLKGGLHHPDDGHVDPSGLTQALAKGARAKGAEIQRFNPVTAINLKPSGEWEVVTEKGTITCEIVVNAAGLWGSAVGRMVGLDLPIIAMEHQHVLFDDVPELVALGTEMPLLRDPDASYYLRQELYGLLIGPYENPGQPWKPDGPPWDYSQAELPPALERIQDWVMAGVERVPALAEVGIKHIVNGPITYTPDSNPLLGPALGLRNFYIIAGFSFGITQAGGSGRYLAEWIVEGEPSIDLTEIDSRRFGSFATKEYTLAKIQQNYPMEYAIGFPNEERPAGRPVKTIPIHDLLAQAGASFGQTFGWERPNWFAPQGVEPQDVLSFQRTNWHGPVGEECRAVRERVGL